jgi:hypothetical protein
MPRRGRLHQLANSVTDYSSTKMERNMTTEVNDVVALKSYLEAAIGRAKTHPGNVDGVILALTGAIVWKKDADPIEPIGSEGDKKNVLWVKFNGIRYAFSYNHSARTVELRKESTDGEVLYSFSNETPYADIISAFDTIRP